MGLGLSFNISFSQTIYRSVHTSPNSRLVGDVAGCGTCGACGTCVRVHAFGWGEGNVTIDVNGQLKSAARMREKKRDRQEPGETKAVGAEGKGLGEERVSFFLFFFFCGVGEEGRHGKARRES